MKSFKINYIIFFVGILVINTNIFSQTYFNGGIFADTKWNLNNSPYIITDTVVIGQKVTLTIEAGVKVLFDKSIPFIINGTLVCEGNSINPVIFSANAQNTGKNYWRGLILGMSSNLELNFTEFLNARTVLYMHNAYGKKYMIKNCKFKENEDVLYKDAGGNNTFIDSCIFENNDYVSLYQLRGALIENSLIINNEFGFQQTYESQILNCKFLNNKKWALNLTAGIIERNTFINNGIAIDNWLGGKHSFKFNIVKENEIGIRISGNPINFEISNNIICNNKVFDVVNSVSKNVDVSNNCFCLTDSSEIRKKISDGYNNITKGLVNFTPFWDSCNESDTIVTSIKENYLTSRLVISPNPATDYITINIGSIGACSNENNIWASPNASIEIYDVMGMKIQTTKVESIHELSLRKIDVSNLSSGVYFVKIGDRVEKFVKY